MSWKEKDFEESMQPSIDNIYTNCFSNIDNIKRNIRTNENSKSMFMDIELGIDTIITFKDGSMITLQEKTLRHTKQHFQQFTFEYYNQPKTKDKGEWFKLASQFYFFGYANKTHTGYLQYWIINVANLRLFLNGKNINKYLRQNPPPAMANFYAIPFDVFDNNIFYKKHNSLEI